MAEIDPTKIDDTSWRRHEALYSSVGQAISMWASMEGEIIEIAALLIGTPERKAGLIFYSIMNFYAWLTIIDELFSMEPIYELHKPDWGICGESLKTLNDTRVRLAHHTVWDNPSKDVPGLRPGKHDARSKSRKHAALSDDDIIRFTQGVLNISDKLTALLKAMRATKSSPQPSLGTLFEQLGDQHIQADVPLDMLSAALKSRPQS